MDVVVVEARLLLEVSDQYPATESHDQSAPFCEASSGSVTLLLLVFGASTSGAAAAVVV